MAQIVPLAPAVIQELDQLALARQIKAEEAELDAERWPKTGPVMTIRGKVGLSCFSQAKAMLDAEVAKVRAEAAPIRPWRAHDLRRTLATGFQRLGVRYEVTEATMNHVSGAKGGVAGIYQRHDWHDEKQTALEAWALHLMALVTPSDATNVVPISAANGRA